MNGHSVVLLIYSTGAMIGDVNLYLSVQNDVKVGECGIMIAENDARGQGKGMEALLLMLRFGW